MNSSKVQVELILLQRIRNLSTYLVLIGLLLSILFSALLGSNSMGWQVALAITALAIGIPHGALDHLVTFPKFPPVKLAIALGAYVTVAAIAATAILKWNVPGFIVIVTMSAVHFGIGDAAFISEIYQRQNQERSFPRFLYAATAGCIPVIFPLISDKSSAALAQVNPKLINWEQGSASFLNLAVLLIMIITLLTLIRNKSYRDMADIASLLLLALFAPPLVAFAIYFGGWHAMRHTARLTLVLDSSQRAIQKSDPVRAFLAAVLPGLPALVATLIVAAAIGIFRNDSLANHFLWLVLVVVWALTVPHMAVTARLDRKALAA